MHLSSSPLIVPSTLSIICSSSQQHGAETKDCPSALWTCWSRPNCSRKVSACPYCIIPSTPLDLFYFIFVFILIFLFLNSCLHYSLWFMVRNIHLFYYGYLHYSASPWLYITLSHRIIASHRITSPSRILPRDGMRMQAQAQVQVSRLASPRFARGWKTPEACDFEFPRVASAASGFQRFSSVLINFTPSHSGNGA